MVTLPNELRQECITVFLKCELFDTVDNLISFCKPIAIIGDLVPKKIKSASSKKLFITLNLPILLETKHTIEGYIFPLFLLSMRDYYDEKDDNWRVLNDLYNKINQELKNPLQGYQILSPWSEHKLFNSIIEIDFQDQENNVIKAIEWQKTRLRTAAFLIHGYGEKYGQEILLTRLLRKLPEFKNSRQISINLASMSEISQLWSKIASYFLGSTYISEISPEQIMDKIFECLQTQNLIFIFSEAHSTYIGFLPDLIQEFWQPILAKDNHKETYLVMFLIDKKGKVCKSGVSLAWHFKNQEHPKFPLHLPLNSKFSYEQLNRWLNDAVEQEILPQSLLTETLLKESQGGVPEIVYQRICQYCNTSWEGNLTKWLIR